MTTARVSQTGVKWFSASAQPQAAPDQPPACAGAESAASPAPISPGAAQRVRPHAVAA